MNSWNRRKFIKTSALTGAAIGLATSPLAVFAQGREINYGGSAWLGHYPVYYAKEKWSGSSFSRCNDCLSCDKTRLRSLDE